MKNLGEIIKESQRGFEEMGCDIADELTEEIGENYGRVGLEIWSSLPVVVGAGVSLTGRALGADYLAIALPIFSWFAGGSLFPTESARAMKRAAWGYAKYGVGAALPFTDRIYRNAVESAPEALEFLQSFSFSF